MSKSLDQQYNGILLKLSKSEKERINRKSHFFRNNFSLDEMDVLPELLGVL